MTNPIEKKYEIWDDKKMIFQGRLDEMVYAWNIHLYNDWAFKELYGHINRDPKWIITGWTGALKLIQVIDVIP